ncbi:MAG TPA: acetate uptake transporter [Rhodospirillales bacterium]|nr:acetate uptake transporter [Rhodospirillales bacterium]
MSTTLKTASPVAAPVQAAVPQSVAIADTTANPAPLGLLCFGLTTVLLSMHNAGLFGLDAMILAMAVFYGGTAQIFAGVFEWRKNNTFAATAFISYGFFWLTLAGIIVFPKLGLAERPTEVAMASYLGMWGLLSFVMFIGTFRLNRALQVTFFLLVVAFALLAIGDLLGSATLKTLAGWEGIVLGFAAIYTGLAQVINEVYGRVLMPLGPVKK